MLDHVFLSVSDIERSIAFYAQAQAPLGITDRVDLRQGRPAGAS
jgi:catechol 2,3-dioxygenase-like lactoylglutathione lyase family enzyme